MMTMMIKVDHDDQDDKDDYDDEDDKYDKDESLEYFDDSSVQVVIPLAAAVLHPPHPAPDPPAARQVRQ